MTTQDRLNQLIKAMPEERARELLDFAEYLEAREEREAWQRIGLAHLAQAYGEDEPEYTTADIVPWR